MARIRSWTAIFMGIVILAADIAWLFIGSSYLYTPWLVLGIVIALASVVWLVMDFSLMEEGEKQQQQKFERLPRLAESR